MGEPDGAANDPSTPAPTIARPSTSHQQGRRAFSTPDSAPRSSGRPGSVGRLNLKGVHTSRGVGGSCSARGGRRPEWNSDYHTPRSVPSHASPSPVPTRAPSRAEGGRGGSPLPPSPLTERGTSPTRGSYRQRLAVSPYAEYLRGSSDGVRSSSAHGSLSYFQMLRASPTPTSRSWSPMGARRARTPRSDPTGTLVSTPRTPHSPFEQRTAQAVYGKTSSLGVQYHSNRKTAPTCSFGRAYRDEYRRTLWVNEDVAAANASSSSDVHSYCQLSSFGPQSEASYQTSPRTFIPATERFPHLSPRKRSPLADVVPGPGAYEVSNEVNILRGQAERATIGTGERFGKKIYISEAHAVAQNDGFADTPGPGSFDTAVEAMGTQSLSHKATASRAVFLKGHRYTEIPGRTSPVPHTPGAYGGKQPGLAMGSGEKGAAAFPMATREARNATYLNQEADKTNIGHVIKTPGPGQYNLEGDFKGDRRGTRALSPNRNSVKVKMGTAKRFTSYETAGPGPAAYH